MCIRLATGVSIGSCASAATGGGTGVAAVTAWTATDDADWALEAPGTKGFVPTWSPDV